MAISFPCPDCKTLITCRDDMAGQRTSCVSCGAYVAVPSVTSQPQQFAAGAPPRPASSTPNLDERITDRPASYDDDRAYAATGPDIRRDFPEIGYAPLPAGWSLARIGLGLMYWATVAMLLAGLAYALLTIGLVVTVAGGRFGADMAMAQLVAIFAFVIGATALAGIVLYIVGQAMCCAVPSESGAKGLAIAALVCMLVFVALTTVLMCMSFALVRENFAFRMGGGMMERGGTVAMLATLLLAFILFLAAHALFVSFLRALGRHFRSYELVQSGGSYLTLFFVLFGSWAAIVFVQALAREPGLGQLFGCLGIVLLILFIVLIVWFLRLLATASDCISAYGRRQ